MSTVYPDNVWRQSVVATKPNPGTEVKQVLLIPEGVMDLTIYAVGSAAACCKIEETASSPASAVSGTPAPTWASVDATLDTVGTTQVRFALGTRTPVALRVSSLTDNQTATLTLVGKRMR
jgi:hypothetical protein